MNSAQVGFINSIPMLLHYMHYLVFLPDEDAMVKAGFGLIAEVPVIFDENWKYHREASWYLRDRSKGEAFVRDVDVNVFPATSSMKQYAYKLADFLSWCDWVRRSWKEVEYYRDLIERYQKHMLEGAWAVERGQKLSPSTVNGRVDEAVWFCKWAVERELRGSFKVQTRTTHRKNGGLRSDSHKYQVVVLRTGKVRQKPIHLRVPKPEMVDAWLNQLYIEKGETKGLMGELILRTAIRRQEAEQWRTTYLPDDRSKWDVTGDYVSVYLEFGTKGDNPRYIDVPIDLAERLAHYQKVTRSKLRMIYVYAAETDDEKRRRLRQKEDRLFLSTHTGLPQSAKKLYEAWTEVSVQPIDGWSPHLGRHYWTCKTLLEQYEERVKQLSEGAVITPDYAMALSHDDILIFVKTQLGHVDAKTTQAYAVWLGKMVRSAKHSQEWVESLVIERTADDEGGNEKDKGEM